MPGEKRTPSDRQRTVADWLHREPSAGQRSWALEEQLLSGIPTPDRDHLLATLAEQLTEERLSLARMEGALHDEMRRVEELQRRLAESHASGNGRAPSAEPPRASPPVLPVRAPGRPDRNYQLSRCVGFRVESPAGEVGVVVGLRFGSLLDRPDLLEVCRGRWRRRSALVPVEAVERIRFEERRISLAGDVVRPPYRRLVHALVLGLRGKVRVSPS